MPAISIPKSVRKNGKCDYDPQIEVILKLVTEFYSPVGVTREVILKDIRDSVIAEARCVFFYLARKHTGMSFWKIGAHVDRKDHSTVMSACRGIEKQLKKDEWLRNAVAWLEKEIEKASLPDATPTNSGDSQ